MKTVAVIPAYNEERHVGNVIRETKKYVDSVIVVDDGSKDGTMQEAEKAGAKVLRHIVNMGKGFALQTGCDRASENADLIVVLDADGQHDTSEIPNLVKALEDGGLDLVIGSRPPNKNMPMIAKFGNWWIHSWFEILFRIKTKDTQSGYRAFTAEAYKKIRWHSAGYFVETESIINASKHKLKYGETPVKTIYHDNYKGTTVIDGVKIFFNMLLWKIRQ